MKQYCIMLLECAVLLWYKKSKLDLLFVCGVRILGLFYEELRSNCGIKLNFTLTRIINNYNKYNILNSRKIPSRGCDMCGNWDSSSDSPAVQIETD